eukprot:661899-Rhodomonas_salina.1
MLNLKSLSGSVKKKIIGQDVEGAVGLRVRSGSCPASCSHACDLRFGFELTLALNKSDCLPG